MDSVVFCYAPGDEIFARNLADFLSRNLPLAISISEAIVRPDLDLIEATERALSAEATLVLLSPHSVPKVWDRRTWEPVFIEKPKQFQTVLGFVLVSECSFPDLFRRGRFFDASSDALRAAREIKRWLLRPLAVLRPMAPVDPALEQLRVAAVDQPGIIKDLDAAAAVQFAGRCAEDFESVYRLDLRDRSHAGIAGDIAGAIGLPFSGRVLEDQAALSDWCAVHRVLFVLAGLKVDERELAAPGGRTSVIFTDAAESGLPGTVPSEAADAVRKFNKAVRIDDRECLQLGWLAVNLLKSQSRFAEACEVLAEMARVAVTHGGTSERLRIEREQYWMQIYRGDGGDAQFSSPIAGEHVQLSFSFAD